MRFFFFAAGKCVFGQGTRQCKTLQWTAKELDHCPLHSTQANAGWDVYGRVAHVMVRY